MNMKAVKLLGALAAALLFAGCSDISSGGSDDSSSAGAGVAYLKVADSSQTLRTALPHYDWTKFDKFTLTYYSAKSSNVELPSDGSGWKSTEAKEWSYAEITTKRIPIPVGTYYFKLTATMTETVHPNDTITHSFSGITWKEITSGLSKDNTLSFTMYPESVTTTDPDGNYGLGGFEITLTDIPNSVSSIVASLYVYDEKKTDGKGEPMSSHQNEPLAITANRTATYTYGSAAVPAADCYLAEFILCGDTGGTVTLATYYEFVIIANEKISKSTISIPALSVNVKDRIKEYPPFAVGDILLSDGSAISYDAALTKDELDAYFSDNSVKTVPLGVVFYTGYSGSITQNQRALGNRIIAVSHVDTSLSWCKSGVEGHKARIDDLVVANEATALETGAYIYDGTYFGWWKDKSNNWVNAFDGCKSFEALDVFADAADDKLKANYPAFDYVKNTLSKVLSTLNADDIPGAFSDYYYLPSVVELLELYKRFDTVNAVLPLIPAVTPFAAGKAMGGDLYWSSSQFPTITDHAWAVDFIGDGAGTAEHRAKTDKLTVRGVIEYVYPKPKGTEEGEG